MRKAEEAKSSTQYIKPILGFAICFLSFLNFTFFLSLQISGDTLLAFLFATSCLILVSLRVLSSLSCLGYLYCLGFLLGNVLVSCFVFASRWASRACKSWDLNLGVFLETSCRWRSYWWASWFCESLGMSLDVFKLVFDVC